MDGKIISAVSQKIVKDNAQPARTEPQLHSGNLNPIVTLCFGSTALQFCKEQWAEIPSQLCGTLKAWSQRNQLLHLGSNDFFL